MFLIIRLRSSSMSELLYIHVTEKFLGDKMTILISYFRNGLIESTVYFFFIIHILQMKNQLTSSTGIILLIFLEIPCNYYPYVIIWLPGCKLLNNGESS